MRVLLATDGNLERQGINSFMLQWLNALRSICNCDLEISVYFRKTIKDTLLKKSFLTLGAEIYCSDIPEDGTSRNKEVRNKIQHDVREILAKKTFDVVHINSSAKGFSALVLREAVRADVPVRILHTHGRNDDSILKQLFLFPLRLYFCCAATLFAGCSVDAGLYMFGHWGVNSSKWHFVPNTIDIEKFAYEDTSRIRCRSKLNLSSESMLIGAVGYLEKIKNHEFLLDVLKELKDREEKAILIVFGNGSLQTQLEAKANALGLSEQVIFYGATNRIAEWLSALDCYVMPSLSEGLPIAAIEAQANGLPCLLSDRIPPEVDLSADVCHLPIDAGPEPWARKIMGLSKKSAKERLLGEETVRRAGFGKESMPEHVRLLYGIFIAEKNDRERREYAIAGRQKKI